MKKIFAALIVSFSFFQVQASEEVEGKIRNVFWQCQTSFSAKGRGLAVLGMGNYELKGNGVMRCRSINLTKPRVPEEERYVIVINNLEELKNINAHLETIQNNTVEIKMHVNMNFIASPLQISGTLGRVELLGFSKGWTLTRNVEELLGDYKLAGAHGTVVFGLGGFVAGKVGKKALSFQMSIQIARGFGALYGFSDLQVKLNKAS